MKTRKELVQYARDELKKYKDIVRVNHAAIREFVAKNGDNIATLPDWSWCLPENLRRDDAPVEDVLYFFFVFNSVNYCYWEVTEDGKYHRWAYGQGKQRREGADGMNAMLQKLYDKNLFPGEALSQRECMAKLGPMLSGMPFSKERRTHLYDVARKEDFVNIIRRAYRKGRWVMDTKLAAQLADEFESFADPLLKRAQLAVAMMAGWLEAKGEKVKVDVTAFADYRVPQVLAYHGILEYSEELQQKIRNRVILPEGSDEERAIRLATLVACASISRRLGVSDAHVDAQLWLSSRDEVFKEYEQDNPFHLTPSTRY